MAHTPTAAQTAAIEERDRTLLVSAAAGAGKTSVLTRRIIRTLTDPEDPTDISRILVVTFTRAAAGELRQRIASALGEELARDPGNTRLTRQLMLLGTAHISTIDSFYLDLVRANFAKAGFPPSFRTADDTELIPLRREIMEDTVDKMFRENPDFPAVADIFSNIRNENALTESLLSIALKLDQYPESAELLLRSAGEMEAGADTPLDTAWGKVYLEAVTELASTAKALFSRTLTAFEGEDCFARLQKKYGGLYAEMHERAEELLRAVADKSYDRIREALTAPFAAKIAGRTPECSAECAALRDLCEHFRKKWKAEAADLGAYSPAEIKGSAAEGAAILRGLYAAISEYNNAYRRAKMLREIAEFSDISRAAYHLLVDGEGKPTPIAHGVADSFDAIYIDEYQDVNAMQDATFRAIAKERNRFMVGDVKQSIYRFRGAQPSVFTDYRRHFPLLENTAPKDPAATIFMSDCFRCTPNVIRFSNAVSGFLFSHHAGSIGYTAEDDLHYPHASLEESPRCRVMILDRKSKEEREEDEEEHSFPEAAMIADEIARLLQGEKKANGEPITPADIAVLMRSSAFAAPLARELVARGIPTNDTSRQSFFENPEVLCMYSLLAAIDNPFHDVYLAAVLRSPFFGFTLEDLVHIRSLGDSSMSLYEALRAAPAHLSDKPGLLSKIADFNTRFAVYRDKARTLPVDRLLRFLYRETAVLSFAGVEEADNGQLIRRGNLRRLYTYARSFEANGFKGLSQFVHYVENVMQTGTKMPAPEGERNAVSLITIHHSKGLEFAVTFVVNTASRFNNDDQKQTFLCTEGVGCATRLSNAGSFSRTDTFFRRTVALQLKKQEREEEMRVLYVAMTRARERLYITGAPRYGAEKVLEKAALLGNPHAGSMATEGASYLEWVLTALQRPDTAEFATVQIVPEGESPAPVDGDHGTPTLNVPTALDVEAELSKLKQRLDFVYPHEHLTRLPAKLSVSRLSPVALDVFDSDADTTHLPVGGEDAEQLLHAFERLPLFEKRAATAAERGTATHEFLQFCDFEAVCRHGVAAELERLISKRFLPEAARDAVRVDELERFFESDLYRAISCARKVYRETRFHLFLPAARFTADPAFSAQLESVRLPVQGVIDLFFIDDKGQLVLCDYKTDRLSPAELRDPQKAAKALFARHGEQLAYYTEALAEIFGKRPERVLIYSLPAGRALEQPQ